MNTGTLKNPEYTTQLRLKVDATFPEEAGAKYAGKRILDFIESTTPWKQGIITIDKEFAEKEKAKLRENDLVEEKAKRQDAEAKAKAAQDELDKYKKLFAEKQKEVVSLKAKK